MSRVRVTALWQELVPAAPSPTARRRTLKLLEVLVLRHCVFAVVAMWENELLIYSEATNTKLALTTFAAVYATKPTNLYIHIKHL